MPSEKFRITTNGQSLRNPSNGFFGMTLSANLTLNENDISAHNDRRSAHNALERQRREHLNMKFQQLAHALPSLQSVRRPSKTMIVSKSLEFVSASLKRESKYTSEIQKLRLENEKLKRQAEAACKQTRKQQSSDDLKQTTTTKTASSLPKDQSILVVKEKNPSLKRRASSELQLSPPPTPKSMVSSKDESEPQKSSVDSSTTDAPPQKRKKTMKLSKLPRTTATTQLIPPITPQQPQQQERADIISSQFSMSSLPRFTSPSAGIPMVTPLKEMPWSPTSADTFNQSLNPTVNDIDIQASTYFNLSSSPYNITNNAPHSPSTISSTNTSYYLTSTSPNNDLYNSQPDSSSLSLQSFSSQQQPYTIPTNNTNIIHPMLLAPYYISAAEATTVSNDFVYPTTTTSISTHIQHHQRQQSGGSDFYLH